MTWDKTYPAPTTKIRDLSNGIPNNWDAIETGDATFKPIGLNLDNRTPVTVPIDPVAISEAMVMYCKDDSNGDPQIFAIDQGSTITQLTPFSFTGANNGIMSFPGGLTFVWGQTTGTTDAKVFHTPFSTSLFNLQVSMIAGGAAYGSQKNQTITGFDWTVSGTPSAIQYFAIGI